MNSKKFISSILLIPILIYLVFLLIYLLNPFLFHYRAWELFDNFIYNGYLKGSVIMDESGDSSRDFVFQKYQNKNLISVNELGNRLACFDATKNKQVLFLGDSQLFGSGLGDDDTLPKQLCKRNNFNIYNGSRIHGLNLLRVKEFNFQAIIFEASEAVGIRSYCNNLPIFYKKSSPQNFDQFEKNLDSKIEEKNLKKERKFIKKITMSNNFLRHYLSSRLITILNTRFNFFAPDENITKYHYLLSVEDAIKDVACAEKLNNFFSKRNVKVGFLYIPLKQTIIKDYDKRTIQSIDYIPISTKAMKERGLKILDSQNCLQESSNFQPHDSHLNTNGMKKLANCIINSNLSSLFN